MSNGRLLEGFCNLGKMAIITVFITKHIFYVQSVF